MGTKTVLGGVFFAIAAAFFASISPASAATTVGGDISGDVTWTTSNSPYIAYGVSIPAGSSLTIEPGVVVKVQSRFSPFYVNGGTLTVGRKDSDRVIITALEDDNAGGDTNGDDDNSIPYLGSWMGIEMTSGTASFENVAIRYGGGDMRSQLMNSGGNLRIYQSEISYTARGVELTGGDTEIYDSLFHDNADAGVYQRGDSIFRFGRNTFANNRSDIVFGNFTGATFQNDGGNSGVGGLYFYGVQISGAAVFPKDGLPYVVGGLTVPEGASLTINPGAVIKVPNMSWPFNIFGTMTVGALGGEKVTFTSILDDNFLGDTNHDETKSVPFPGSWCAINAAQGRLDIYGAKLLYGGCDVYAQLYINNTAVTIADSQFFDAKNLHIMQEGGSLTMTRSELANASGGVAVTGNTGVFSATISQSSFYNLGYGVANASAILPVHAENNWWGDASGPRYSGNSSGIGVWIYGNVLFDPWLTKDPFWVCTVDCHSSVLFLPGIMGSRLYGIEGVNEEELWVSNSDSLQKQMEMNTDGTSKNDVYTKNDIRRDNDANNANETGLVDHAYGDLYRSFLNDLRDWKAQGVFADYAFIPYDWRLSPKDIVMNGWAMNGRLTYMYTNTDLTKSHLYQQAKALQASSHSGKLTLIGHSNGGLVIKAFIQKLKEENDPLYSQIDKVIFVGVPQLGTPDTTVSLLYGSKIGIAWLGVSAQITRKLGHYMPGMYNLLPSQELFDVINPPIEFKGNNIDPAWTSRYGDKIDTYTEFKDFLTGKEGRSRPDQTDTRLPEVLDSALVGRAEDNHDVWDDWEPSSDTEVIQIAGWGLYTVSGLEITDAKLCPFDANRLDNGRPVCSSNQISTVTVRDRLTLNGDATVIVPSALEMASSSDVKKYWVDLARYNDAKRISLKHKDILEADILRPFIKSLIENTGVDFQYISDSEPTRPSNLNYVKYEIHSPLHLTVTDANGNKAGWDSGADSIVENINGAQYFEIGEVKMLLVPEEIEHIVKLSAYEQGSFTLNIDKLDGEEVVSETKFEAIPVLVNSIVDVVPATVSEPVRMSVDFDANGSIDTTLEVVPGETTEYENPVEQDTVAPEIAVTFDQATKDVVWKVTDDQDVNPSLVVTATEVTATDRAGNTAVIPFVKYRENATRLKVQFEKVVYNSEEKAIPKTTLIYDWKLKKDVLTDLDTELRLKEKSRLKAEYRKQKNETRIVERDKEEKTRTVTVKPGFVSVSVETKQGDIIWGY